MLHHLYARFPTVEQYPLAASSAGRDAARVTWRRSDGDPRRPSHPYRLFGSCGNAENAVGASSRQAVIGDVQRAARRRGISNPENRYTTETACAMTIVPKTSSSGPGHRHPGSA